MHTGWLGHQYTNWTNRDVLVACAISLSAAVQALDKDDKTMVDTAASLVGELCALCSEDVLDLVGYGLSTELLRQLSLSIGEILTRQPDNGAWHQMRERMEGDDYDEELARIWSALERLPIDTRRFRSAFRTASLSAAAVLQTRKVQRWAAEHEQEATVLGWEIASRLRRLDFPVIDRETPLEMILGADVITVWDRDSDHVGVKLKGSTHVDKRLLRPQWHVADDSFEAGLEAGRKAAVQLLRECGIPVQTLGVGVELRGPLPPASPVHDASAGLPLALHILAEKSDLSAFGYVATGAIDPQTLALEPLPWRDVMAKHRAMKADGVNHTLVAYAPDVPTESPVPDGMKLVEGATLNDAARAIWGAKWDQWRETHSRARLKELGFERGWMEGLWPGALEIAEKPVIVPMAQVDQLLERFTGTYGKTAFLGGPPQSGKTWIAQQLEVQAHARQWATIVLNPHGDARLTQDNLTAAIALHLRVADPRPALVIIDNIEWSERLEDFEDQLGSVAEALDVNILAVMRSDDDTSWKSNEGLAPVVGIRRTRDFAERLVNHGAFGEARKRLAPLIGKIAEGGDLNWVVGLAKLAYEEGEFAPTVELFVKPRLEKLTSAQRQDARSLAALAYVGLDAPDWFVGDVTSLRELGARERGLGRSFLPSRYIATGVLRQDGRSPRGEAEKILSRFVLEAIRRDDSEVPRILRRLAREAPEMLAMICRERRQSLDAWMETVVQPEQLGRALDAVKEHIQPSDRGKWAHRLLRLLLHDFTHCKATDLALILDLLQLHQFSIERLEDGSTSWSTLMARLETDLARILAREEDSRAKLELLRALWRLHDTAAYRAITGNAELFLTFQPPYDFEDYKLALEFGEISGKLPKPVSLFEHDGVEALTGAEVSGSSADVYAAQLVLRSSRERIDWTGELFPVAVPQLAALLARSTPRQICNAVSIFGKFDRTLATGLFNQSRVASALVASIDRFTSAGEIANLIDLVAHAHLQTAYRLLYEDLHGYAGNVSARVRPSTLNLAYRTIVSRGDGKGAGRLIRAAFNVDMNFASVSSGFARRLGDRLGEGFFLQQCEWEPRTSVLFYLLEGLISIDAPFLPVVLQTAVEAIAQQIDRTTRPWAPRLALLLADSSTIGEAMAAELSRKITPKRLLECMTESPTVESLDLFHRLGTYLHQESVPQQFAIAFGKDPIPLYEKLNGGQRPEQVIRAARTVSHTLRRGGDHEGGKEALRGVHRNWTQWLRAARTDGDLAESIRGLAALDEELAQTTVAASRRYLAERAQEAMRRHPQGGVELLDAIESASRGAGREIIDHMKRTQRTWTATMRQIAHVQDPREQGTIFSMLAQLGAVPESDEINNVFGRWRVSIGNLTSPPALVMLLRALSAWDFDRTASLAANLPIDRIARRLETGSKYDLEWVEAFIGALRNLKCFEAADRILDALETLDSRRLVAVLGPERTAKLLIGLKVWRDDMGDRLSAEASSIPSRASNDRYVSNDSSLVWNLGWLAYAISIYGRAVDLGDEKVPWIYSVSHDPGTIVWGVGWFGRQSWSDKLLENSMKRIQDSAAVEPSVAAATLIVGLRRGCDVDVPFLIGQSVHETTSLYLIEALLETALVDARLAAALSLEELGRRSIDAAHVRLSPPRERIEARLAALRAQHGIFASR
ncbi:MAG TPA: hypothetical protein VE974_01325 [Thermoanaerobaculia bacterium]|nr:hypothetical protein [Thermoanaerobaculia bacterium]